MYQALKEAIAGVLSYQAYQEAIVSLAGRCGIVALVHALRSTTRLYGEHPVPIVLGRISNLNVTWAMTMVHHQNPAIITFKMSHTCQSLPVTIKR